MPKRVRLQPDWPYSKNASFSQGVMVGETIYVAGQAALDADGKVVGVGDMKAQARQTFANIAAVLKEAGATLDDIVKITTYITDMSRYADYSAVRKEMFTNNLPASATVASPVLVFPELLIEIEAIAVKGSGAGTAKK